MRADYPEPVSNLISELKHLPGIGPRSAERIAVWLLQHPKAEPSELAESLVAAEKNISSCEVCGFFATEDGCTICDAGGRDGSLLCVVEQATDILPIERSGAFNGYYHSLGGKLSPLDNVTPEQLRIPQLMRRIDPDVEMEIILALGADVEGDATANYLADMLEPHGCRVSRIAQGISAGGSLVHADELTLMRAMQGRREV